MATIEERRGRDGKTTCRARISVRGQPECTRTFERRTDARTWARHSEAGSGRGRYVATPEATEETAADAVDKYLRDVLPHETHNRNRACVEQQLRGWKKGCGP